MPKLLKINAKVHLPGATAAKWSVTWPANDPYLMARILSGGLSQGDLVAVQDEPGFWTWAATDKIFGGELGDKPPPLVTVKITPTMAAGKKVLPIVYQGHPREITPPVAGVGGGEWDLSRIGSGGGPVLASETQLISLAAGLTDLDTKKARADADHTASLQSLADSAQTKADLLASVAATQAALQAAGGASIAATAQQLASLQAQYLITQQKLDALTLLGDVNNLYAAIGISAAQFEADNGWSAYPVAGFSAMTLSVSSGASPIQVTALGDDTLQIDANLNYALNYSTADEISLVSIGGAA